MPDQKATSLSGGASFSPYDALPAAKKPTPNPTDAAVQAVNEQTKRKRDDELPASWGWIKVPSTSRPGKFSYVNKFTKEKIGWVPDRPASKQRKDLPPAPKVEKKIKRDPDMDPEEKLRIDGDKLKTALGKVKVLLQDEAHDKFKVGLQVVHKSFHSSAALTGDTEPHYFEVLKITQNDPSRHLAEGCRSAIKRLFTLVKEKRDKFDVSHHYQLDTWIMRCVTHHQLYTDDSYKFNAAVKDLKDALWEAERTNKKRIIELAGTDQDFEEKFVPPEHLQERKQVIVETMSTLHSRSGLPWATPTVKSFFKDVSDRRSIFTDEQRTMIDEAIDALQDRLNGKHKQQNKETHNAGIMQGRVIPRRKF